MLHCNDMCRAKPGNTTHASGLSEHQRLEHVDLLIRQRRWTAVLAEIFNVMRNEIRLHIFTAAAQSQPGCDLHVVADLKASNNVTPHLDVDLLRISNRTVR